MIRPLYRHLMSSPTRLLSRLLGGLTAIVVVGGITGCARPHLSDDFSKSSNQIFALQTRPRLAQQEMPAPLAAEDAKLVVDNLRATKPGAGGDGKAAGMMELITLQR